MRSGTLFAVIFVSLRRSARRHWGAFIMLVFALILLWLAACLGVLSVWVLRDAPAPDAAKTRESTAN
jgi:hypothetical protein